jgi:hypothetical protein
MKFKSDLDRSLFLLELGQPDSTDIETLSEEVTETFIKRRRKLIGKLRDFRKSQDNKASWRRFRFKMYKGLKTWHKSTKGKRFHRQLGRFLATKMTENLDKVELERYETLKALSSLHTHMYIEGEYFRPSIDEDVDYETMVEYSLPLLTSLELKILEYKYADISPDEIEIVLRLTEESEVTSALSALTNSDQSKIKESLKAFSIDEDQTYGLSLKYYQLLEMKSSIDILQSLTEIENV